MILIVGSTSPNTATYSVKINLGKSFLYEGKLSDSNIYHTSMADCSNLKKHLHLFEVIYWAKSDQSEFKNFKEYFETIYLLKNHGNVIGLDDDPYNLFESYQIVNNSKKIVFFGCSHTEGGYVEPEEEYYSIVSKHYNLIPLNLAKGNKGNFRSFDIFNQVNFISNQIVVLQLTDFARLKYFPNDLPETKLHESQLYLIKNPAYIEVYNDKQLIYNTLSRLDLIVKFCRSNNLRLVFFNLGNVPNFDNDPGNDRYKKIVEYYLSNYKEYIPDVVSKCVDRGKDNLHWGKLSNQMFADEIIKKIESLY